MIRAVLTDIEGTTSSIRFVKDVLFPYARRHLPEFVATHADDPQVQHWLTETAREAGLEPDQRDEIVATLQQWIDDDRKATPLKALQGMIWERGYAEDAYRAHVYTDVPVALRSWHARGLRLYVYSSGSVASQKLFFSHSQAGDLTPLFSGYFDTETGPKRETESYRRIAGAIGLPAEEIVFLSDVVAELDAAHEAGMHTMLLARPPVGCPRNAAHRCVGGFDAFDPGAA